MKEVFIKCDRCKKGFNRIYKYLTFISGYINIYDKYNYMGSYDLCHKCLKSFKVWLNSATFQKSKSKEVKHE